MRKQEEWECGFLDTALPRRAFTQEGSKGRVTSGKILVQSGSTVKTKTDRGELESEIVTVISSIGHF